MKSLAKSINTFVKTEKGWELNATITDEKLIKKLRKLIGKENKNENR